GGSGCDFGLAKGFARGTLRRGKSSMEPDHVSSVLSKAGLCREATGRSGHGKITKAKCQRAAARMARRGNPHSTRQSRKTKVRGTAFDRWLRWKVAATLLRKFWWKLPQAISSFGSTSPGRMTWGG